MSACTAIYIDDTISIMPILRALAAQGYTLVTQDGKLIITRHIPCAIPRSNNNEPQCDRFEQRNA